MDGGSSTPGKPMLLPVYELIPPFDTGAALKRKLTSYSLATKYQAIVEVEKGTKSICDIAKQFGVPLNTLSNWRRRANDIKDSYAEYDPSIKKLRVIQYPDVENALLIYLKDARSRNMPLSNPALQSKAIKYGADLGHIDFSCTDCWLGKFRMRHEIKFKKDCDSDNANFEIPLDSSWYTITLPNLFENYSPDSIYVVDETGLFYKLRPSFSLTMKGKQYNTGGNASQRLSVLACTNMSGNDKLPLLVVGKQVTLQNSKYENRLPTDYKANEKSWFTSDLFSNWLRNFDKKLKGKKIALILDNAPCHQNIQLSSIELVFVPPSIFPCTQPSANILNMLKGEYKRLMVKKFAHNIESGQHTLFNLLDALTMLSSAWKSISESDIVRSFKQARYVTLTEATSVAPSPEAVDVELSELLEHASAAGIDFQGTFEDYVSADNELFTTASLSDDVIVDMVKSKKICDTTEPCTSEEKSVQTEPLITTKAVLDHCANIKDYLLQLPDSKKAFSRLRKIERFIASKEAEKLKFKLWSQEHSDD